MTANGNIYELLPPGLASYEGTLTTLKKQSVKRLLATLDDERKVFLGGWVSGMRTASQEREALHKALLAGMKKKPQVERREIEQQLIEAEGGAIDFSDEADIGAIVHAARFGREGEY